MTPLTSGLRLHDRFVLAARIGVGGMAEVWRAVDEVLERPVAVKVITADLGGDATVRAATHREARAAARLSHPHITRVYDYGEAALPGGAVAPYLVMELLEGRTLAERLAEGALPWPEAARVGAQVAAGLAAAHASGVVHCDVKPGNVMLTPSGAKVLDFGVASLAGMATADAVIYGTPGFLPPERLAGAPPAPAGDVYALGVLLGEALSGCKRDVGGAAASFPAVAGLPPEVARLGAACLAASPSARPSAVQVARVLAAAAGTATPPTALSPVSPAPVFPRGRASVPAPPPPVPAPEPVPAVVAGGDPTGPRRRGSGGRAAVAAVTALILVLALGYLFSKGVGDPGGTGDVRTQTQPSSKPSAPVVEVPPADDPAEEPVDDDVVPGGLPAALRAIEAAVRLADFAGRIDDDAARRIDDRLGDLREAVENRDPADIIREADDLREALERRRNGERIDPAVREELLRLLEPFTSP